MWSTSAFVSNTPIIGLYLSGSPGLGISSGLSHSCCLKSGDALKINHLFLSKLIAISENGFGTGSGRSTKDLDIGKCFLRLKENNLLLSGGGHSMAAGLKIEQKKISEAKKMLANIYKPTNECKNKKLQINAVLSTSAVSIKFIEELNSVGPFGSESPFPIIVFPNCIINHVQILGEKHVKISFSNTSGARIEGLLFNALDTDIGQFLIDRKNRKLHIAGRMEINEWGGRKKVNVIIVDIAPNN